MFTALVDYLNRADRKAEPRRIRKVMNNHIVKGGHLSAQPMGALRDFVARDPRTELPAVVNFPVLRRQPVPDRRPGAPRADRREAPRAHHLRQEHGPPPEPVAEIRRLLDDRGIEAVIMYDMAHVLGLVGPHFQEPFTEGADIVTGSTHKTFFGTQRGVVGARFTETDER